MRLKYVKGYVDRKTGKPFFYFRRKGFPQVRLRGVLGSKEFMDGYRDALNQAPRPIGMSRTKSGSVSEALVSYYGSLAFRKLAPATQTMRRAILEKFRDQTGELPVSEMPAKYINTVLNKLQPHAARSWFKAIRALMQHAVAMEMCKADPTYSIKLPSIKSDGIHTWDEDEIAIFEAKHAAGTKARLAFALLLYTAQRRSDVIKFGHQHIRNGAIHLRQKKTGTFLSIPIHPELAAIIDAAGTGALFLVTKSGKSYSPNDFSDQFREWCDEAGLPVRCSAHGLRKAACRRLAEAGCSANQIAAISGHKTLKEVERYTRAADQVRLATQAMANVVATISVQSAKKASTN
jgi:integrase